MAEDKTVKLSMYLPEQLRLRFKLACTAKQVSMNQVLIDFVEEWTNENDPMQKQPSSPYSLPSPLPTPVPGEAAPHPLPSPLPEPVPAKATPHPLPAPLPNPEAGRRRSSGSSSGSKSKGKKGGEAK